MSSYQLGRMRRSEAGRYCRGRLVVVFLVLTVAEARAESCPQPTDEIATDRPDVTNSSLVVPVGSFQSENGVNLTARDGSRNFDGSDTVAARDCSVPGSSDRPPYLFFANTKAPGSSGFSDVADQSGGMGELL